MQNLEIPTTTDIRAVVRDELVAFFATHPLQTPSDTDEVGGIELAVRITGLAKPTIYSLVSERKIPHSKQTKKLYFSRKELSEWLRAGKRKTQAEIALEAENFSPKKSPTNKTVTER